MRGGHLLNHWRQAIALSSGEAELNGIVKGAAAGLGLQSVGRDLAAELEMNLYTDSSAAMDMLAGTGLGGVGHVEVGELWMQQEHEQTTPQCWRPHQGTHRHQPGASSQD